MSYTEQDWKRLGKAIGARRKRLGLGVAEVAELARMSTRSLIYYEKGRPPKGDDIPPGYHRVEAVVRWGAGSIERVLGGSEPVVLESPAPAESDPVSADLLEAVMSRYGLVAEFGYLCERAGGASAERDAFDGAARRLLESVPGVKPAAMLRDSYGLAASRPHEPGEHVPIDDLLRAYRAADEAGMPSTGHHSSE